MSVIPEDVTATSSPLGHVGTVLSDLEERYPALKSIRARTQTSTEPDSPSPVPSRPRPMVRKHRRAASDHGPVPPVTRRLLKMGRNQVAQETNVARAAIWSLTTRALPAPGPDQVVSVRSVLYGAEVLQTAGPSLTVAEQRWFAELTTEWIREGCPSHRQVAYSLREAAQILGYADGGGTQLRRLKASLRRLKQVTYESRLRGVDDDVEPPWTLWGLINEAKLTPRGAGPVKGWVELNRELCRRIAEEEYVTYHDGPTWDKLLQADGLAARLWCFLEAEALPSPGRSPVRYRLFAGSRKPGDTPPIAELLGIAGWRKANRVAQRVRHCCELIGALDGRYHVWLPHVGVGAWELTACRERQVVTKPRVVT